LIIKVKVGDKISITIPFDMVGINNPVASGEGKGWGSDDYLGCSYEFYKYDTILKEWIYLQKDDIDILAISGEPPPIPTSPCDTAGVGGIRAMIPLYGTTESDLTYEDVMITIQVNIKGLYKVDAMASIENIKSDINYSESRFCTLILAE
jgi:hypothetical protein